VDTSHLVQSKNRNRLKTYGIYISFVILVIIVVSLAQTNWVNEAKAEDEEIGQFATLIQDLQTRVEDEGLLISLTLHTPISNGVRRVTVGEGYAEITTSVYDIGLDYLCLREIQGSAEVITCLNYDNIAGIDYINN
jgi:hypothetical protein